MGRGPTKKATKNAQVLAAAADMLAKAGVVQGLELPTETASDKMREAQSTLDFFESFNPDSQWAEKDCKTCNRTFRYRWNSRGIGYCGMTCMAAALEKIGIKWDSTKLPSERWGKAVPKIVPPDAVQVVLSLQEDLLHHESDDLPVDDTA